MACLKRHRPALLLTIIYVAFVGLGLPDTVLGAVWPAVRAHFGLPLDAAGQAVLLTMAAVTASSLATGRLIERAGTGLVLVVSCLLAAGALVMNAVAPSWSFMLGTASLGGLAGGAIDTSLNGYVARHYSARHMNWLHAFWGVGATIGPLTAAMAMQQAGSWRYAYAMLGAAEFLLGALFLATLPLWKEPTRARPLAEPGPGPEAESNTSDSGAPTDATGAPPGLAPATRAASPRLTPAARASVLFFAAYGAIEASIGLWSASFLVATRQVSPAGAGAAVAVYWGGLTGGRLLLGALASGGSELRLVRAGLWTVFPALLVIAMGWLPVSLTIVTLGLLGAALGPIYPTLMHDTAVRYGHVASVRLVGYQVAACSVGVAILPWLVGLVTRSTSIVFFPACVAVLATGAVALERWRRR